MSNLCQYIQSKNLADFVVASPDAGFAKSARKYANYLKAPVVIADKVRSDHDEKAEIMDVIGNVHGKDVVIVDDFTISGGTLVEMSYALKKLGAGKIYACVTHALLRERGLKALEDSPIEEMVITDTVDNPSVYSHPKIKMVTVTKLFAQAVKIIHDKDSLSTLFEDAPPAS
jgi:ribose-phosphate pyrophosphokinase